MSQESFVLSTLGNYGEVRTLAKAAAGSLVALLPDTGIPAAVEIAERIRAAIAEISLPGADVTVTASLGVVGFPDHATTLDRLEWLADAALYIAKREGRNRVEIADPASADPPAADPAVVLDTPA